MKLKYSLDDMRLFCQVARLGSYTQAAAKLNMPLSTLSRRIHHLEQTLQLRLLHRDAHQVKLTQTGLHYFDRCSPLFDELCNIAGDLHQEKHLAQGKIHVSTPINLTYQWLAALFNQFMLQYPGIQIDLSVSNNNIDLNDKAIDLAIRVGDIVLADWIARPLATFPYLLCCSSEQGQWKDISDPNQLDEYPLIVGKPVNVWQLQHLPSGRKIEYQPGSNVRLCVDDLNIVLTSVMQGIGIALLPTFLIEPHIASGKLMQIGKDWQGSSRSAYIVYRDRENQPLRLRLLIDYIAANFPHYLP